MTITNEQRVSIMVLWGKVCKDRGWKSSDKALRLAKFSELIGRPITSTNEIERLAECTKLMAELKCLLGSDLRAGQEAVDPHLNSARVIRNQILTELIPCLEVYRKEKLPADIADIMADKNRWWKLDRPARDITLMDLDDLPIFRYQKTTGAKKYAGSQLRQMQWTLSRWLNELRNAAGDSIHDMKIKALLPCDCAQCVTARNQAALAALDQQAQAEAQAEEAWWEQEAMKESAADEAQPKTE